MCACVLRSLNKYSLRGFPSSCSVTRLAASGSSPLSRSIELPNMILAGVTPVEALTDEFMIRCTNGRYRDHSFLTFLSKTMARRCLFTSRFALSTTAFSSCEYGSMVRCSTRIRSHSWLIMSAVYCVPLSVRISPGLPYRPIHCITAFAADNAVASGAA